MRKLTVLLFATVLAACGFIEAFAQETSYSAVRIALTNATAPARIVVVNTRDGVYRTKLIAKNDSSTPAQWQVTEPGCYPLPAQTIAANGAAVRDTAGDFCSEIVLADEGAVDVRSVINFNNGKSKSSFVVGAIGAVTTDFASNVGPVINDGETSSYLTFIASEKTAITITNFDGARNQLSVEEFDIPKGASQVVPATKFPVGFISVALGFTRFGIYPSRAPLYGFVAVSRADTSNTIIYPFGQ